MKRCSKLIEQLPYCIPNFDDFIIILNHWIFQGPPKFKKAVLKKGDKTNFPKKGDTVSCWYTGSLEDGTVFDTNIPASMDPFPFNHALVLRISLISKGFSMKII